MLIFENGPSMQEQMILEDILAEIGRNNKLADFPKKINFDEANVRLVEYNKASKEKVKVIYVTIFHSNSDLMFVVLNVPIFVPHLRLKKRKL